MHALLVSADKGCHTSGFLRRQAPCLAEALRCTPGLGSAQRQECDQSGRGSWGGTHLSSLPYSLALLFNLDSIKARSPAEGNAYLPDFTEHALLAWELKPHLEDGLSPGEMEVAPEATDGDSRESRAGKGDSPRTV